MVEKGNELFEGLLDNLNEGVCLLNEERKIVYWNKGAEAITGYSRAELLERECSGSIINYVDEWGNNICENACFVKQAANDGKIHEVKAYLRHKEGYRLPVLIKVIPMQNKKIEIIGTAEVFFDNSPRLVMPQRINELKRMSLLDPLTEIGNRKYVEIYLHSRLEEMHRYNISFGILFISIDRLKDIRDIYGLEVKNKVLTMVTKTLENNLRFFDFIGRWDEEELVVIITNLDESRLDFISNKLRLLVRASSLAIEAEPVGVTISVGATIARLSDDPENLLKRVKKLMEQSKVSGGDQVSLRLKT